MKAVVDENVAIVANDIALVTAGEKPKASQADDKCRESCVDFLIKLVKSGIVVIDEAGELMALYRRYLSGKGQPGTGDMFLKHLSDQAFDSRRVQRIGLAKRDDGSYEAFPAVAGLAKFDQSDRIFVALAIESGGNTRLANAVDSDYSEFAGALKEAGVSVTELCPHCLK